MKKEETKQFIRWCILGAVGCGFMAAGDWLLGCIPLQETDTGLFNRAYYLSGSYGLWRPILTVGLGAIGGFLYYFVVKAFLCGIFTVAIALTIHTWVATMAWFATYLGPRIGAEIRTVPGGHVSFIVQAERYLDLMETFLQRNGI